MIAAGALRGVSVASGQVEVRLCDQERGRTVSSRASSTQRWVRGMEGPPSSCCWSGSRGGSGRAEPKAVADDRSVTP